MVWRCLKSFLDLLGACRLVEWLVLGLLAYTTHLFFGRVWHSFNFGSAVFRLKSEVVPPAPAPRLPSRAFVCLITEPW